MARAAQPLPQAVADAARRSWFDTVAAMTAGVGENCTRAAFLSCDATPTELSAVDAALVLGTASHALDYDDVCMLATCHPSAPIVSGLLAVLPLIERQGAGSAYADILGAYALGTETMLRLGEWLGFRHYALGFHATSTLGTVGVAAAVAHALGMDAEASHRALAIAASSSSGLRANFGTDTKPLHVGIAAAAGVRAVLLARCGASASDDVWGAAGFANAFNGMVLPECMPWKPDTAWALEAPGFEHKRFPSCYMTHRMIAGVLLLRARNAQRLSERVSIGVQMPSGGCAPLKHPRPVTGLQAKFSGPYCAAQAWIDGRVDLASFSDVAVARDALRSQMERVDVQERTPAGEALDTAPVLIRIEGSNWCDSILVDWAPGSAADPMSRTELLEKWCDCAIHAGLSRNPAIGLCLLDGAADMPLGDILGPIRQSLLSAIGRASS